MAPIPKAEPTPFERMRQLTQRIVRLLDELPAKRKTRKHVQGHGIADSAFIR